jgi:hypothetical protein
MESSFDLGLEMSEDKWAGQVAIFEPLLHESRVCEPERIGAQRLKRLNPSSYFDSERHDSCEPDAGFLFFHICLLLSILSERKIKLISLTRTIGAEIKDHQRELATTKLQTKI